MTGFAATFLPVQCNDTAHCPQVRSTGGRTDALDSPPPGASVAIALQLVVQSK